MERRDDEAGRQQRPGAAAPGAQEREASGPGAPVEADRDPRAARIAERERERRVAESGGEPSAGQPPPDDADWTI